MSPPEANVGPLGALHNLDPTDSVVVATVAEVRNRNVSWSHSGERIRPELLLEGEDVLWGQPHLERPIFATNTFVAHGAAWGAQVQVGVEWVRPGDTILMRLTWDPGAAVDGQVAGASHFRAMWYLPSGARADLTRLLTTKSVRVDWESVGGDGKGRTIAEMFGAVLIEREQCGSTLQDVRNVLPTGTPGD